MDDVRLTRGNIEGIERIVARTGWTVSEVVNMAVAEYLHDCEEIDRLRAIEQRTLAAMLGPLPEKIAEE